MYIYDISHHIYETICIKICVCVCDRKKEIAYFEGESYCGNLVIRWFTVSTNFSVHAAFRFSSCLRIWEFLHSPPLEFTHRLQISIYYSLWSQWFLWELRSEEDWSMVRLFILWLVCNRILLSVITMVSMRVENVR